MRTIRYYRAHFQYGHIPLYDAMYHCRHYRWALNGIFRIRYNGIVRGIRAHPLSLDRLR